MGCETKLTECAQAGIRKVWYKWGFFVGRKPKTVIVSSMAVVLLCCLRLILIPVVGDLPSEERQEYLFTPQDSRGFEDMLAYDETWGAGSSGTQIYITTKTEGGNVLTSAVLTEIGRFADLINKVAATSYGDEVFDKAYTREDLCYPASARPYCPYINDPLELFVTADGNYNFDFTDEEIASIVQSGVGIDDTLFPPGRSLATDMMYGGRTYDADGTLVKAEAVRLNYYLQEGSEEVENLITAWEEELNYLVGPEWTVDPPSTTGSATNGSVTWSSDTVVCYPETSGAIGRELSNNIGGDIPIFIGGIWTLIAYTVFVLVSPKNPVSSRGMLLIAGLTSTGMAIACSFGLASLFVENNVVVNVLPFVILGIGVDDMFVLAHALSEVSVDLPVAERIAEAMGHAGASITVTSLTDIIAFGLGATTVLPGLGAFCVFAVFGVLGDFLLQVSFFAGFMALDARREKSGSHDCFPCNPCKASLPGCCKRYYTLQQLNQMYYVPFLRKPVVKALLLSTIVGFCGFMGWAASNLQQDFSQEWFVNTDAQLTQSFEVRDEYFTTTGGPQLSISTPPSTSFDYTSIASQQQLLELATAVDGNEYIVADSYEGWYELLRAYLHECVPVNATAAAYTAMPDYCSAGTDDAKFMVTADGTTVAGVGETLADCYIPPAYLYEYLAEYVQTDDYGNTMTDDFVWVSDACGWEAVKADGPCSTAEAAEGLTATRMSAFFVALPTSSDAVDAMFSIRADVDAVGAGDTYAYTSAFVFFEQFAVIVVEAFTNLGLSALACFFLVLLTVSSIRAALMVLLCVVMVDVDILGLMWLWGLTIDSVTLINLVLAIGLVVDYSAHVAHAFVIAKGTKQERADEAIGNMGSAVFHGAMSTFAAVVILSASTSYIYRVFFVQFFGICMFGMLHGLVFLPVLLSLVGPPEINVDGSGESSTKGKITAAESSSGDVASAATPSTEAAVNMQMA